MRLTTICALMSALVLSPSVVHADPADPVMVVSIRGLDLHSNGDAATAIARINRASQAYCQGSSNPREIVLYAGTLRCRREMADKAIRALDAPRVTALYNDSASVQLASP